MSQTTLGGIPYDAYTKSFLIYERALFKKRSRQKRYQQRQRTCWNAKKVLTFLWSVLTSDWLKQQKLTKLYKAVHIFILTFQPSSI